MVRITEPFSFDSRRFNSDCWLWFNDFEGHKIPSDFLDANTHHGENFHFAKFPWEMASEQTLLKIWDDPCEDCVYLDFESSFLSFLVIQIYVDFISSCRIYQLSSLWVFVRPANVDTRRRNPSWFLGQIKSAKKINLLFRGLHPPSRSRVVFRPKRFWQIVELVSLHFFLGHLFAHQLLFLLL